MIPAYRLSDRTPQAPPAPLHTIIEAGLPALVAAILAVQVRRNAAYRVDGAIIGTGAADFTTNNVCYRLTYGDQRIFQLFDVPGIEGDESKFAATIKAAVAKAHLVVYVNGTNKKPEKATAEKIRAYLGRGSQVLPVVNVRGSADAYEFEEDRVSLSAHGQCGQALRQTAQVLRGVLGDDVVADGLCVQGLLGFSALAMRDDASTIDLARQHDLGLQQRNYLKHFGASEAMLDFSQLRRVCAVLDAKAGTFKHDIVESNKAKVRELLVANIAILNDMLAGHRIFLEKAAPEFDKCRAAVSAALCTFERVLGAARRNTWSQFFNDLSAQADAIVEAHFGDNERISAEIETAFARERADTGQALCAQIEKQMHVLQESLAQATLRLLEDVRRVDFQQSIGAAGSNPNLNYQHAGLDMDLSGRELGAIAFNIGSYAALGAGIGSMVPVIGSLIGAIAGAAVGALMGTLGYFSGKEKRIRKTQSEVKKRLDEVRAKVIDSLSGELAEIRTAVHAEVDQALIARIDAMHASLQRPLAVIERQIALMSNTKNQLEKMPHGTIQAI